MKNIPSHRNREANLQCKSSANQVQIKASHFFSELKHIDLH